MISHMINNIIDLTWLGQFYIITHLKVDLSLIIYHLIYLTFLVNFLNQLLNQLIQSTSSINLYWIGDATGLWYIASLDVCT